MPSAEGVRDLIGKALVAGEGIDIEVDDAANTITVSLHQDILDRLDALEV